MQVVIEISEEIYSIAMEGSWKYPADDVYQAIKNGAVLPETYGRLIDANELEDEFGCEDRDIYAKEFIREASTVLKAYKGDVSNDK